VEEKVEQVSKWILSYLREEISQEEQQQLDSWIAEHPANKAVWENLINQKTLSSDIDYLNRLNTAPFWEKIVANAEPPIKQRPVIAFRWMYVAAAAVMIGIVFSIFYYFIYIPGKKPGIVDNNQSKTNTQIAPGGDGAVLTLSDGTSIILDSTKNGVVTEQGNTKVVKTNSGELKYETGSKQAEVVYNLLTTPRGKKFSVQLPDGTIVWLNAASSLRYPTVFTGSERKVELTGEAYFEVTKLEGKPFKVAVTAGKTKSEVEVLGTHFNIMAYADEPAIATTLLEGKVKVSAANLQISKMLAPGQQSRLSSADEDNITIIREANTEQALAWKNGNFDFENTDIKTIMRQIERWYDVEVVYEGIIPEKTYRGGTSRAQDVRTVLDQLEYAGINCNIVGRKIIVTP
jgi:transmembrane sensor